MLNTSSVALVYSSGWYSSIGKQERYAQLHGDWKGLFVSLCDYLCRQPTLACQPRPSVIKLPRVAHARLIRRVVDNFSGPSAAPHSEVSLPMNREYHKWYSSSLGRD